MCEHTMGGVIRALWVCVGGGEDSTCLIDSVCPFFFLQRPCYKLECRRQLHKYLTRLFKAKFPQSTVFICYINFKYIDFINLLHDP